MTFKGHSRLSKCHSSIERIWFPIAVL